MRLLAALLLVLVSTSVNAQISPPTNLTNNLTWTDNSTDEDTFEIERVREVPANTIQYTDAIPTPGTYCYRVRAKRGTEYSDYTNQVCKTTIIEPPATDTTVPTILLVSPDNGAVLPKNTTVQVSATVTDNVGVAQVSLIWRNGTYSWIVNCASPQTNFTCVKSGSTYTWSIVTATGTRSWSVRGVDTSGNAAVSITRTINLQ